MGKKSANKNVKKKQVKKPLPQVLQKAKPFKPALQDKKKDKTSLFAFFVIALTFICFFPSLNCDFTNLDDQYYILNNNDIKTLSLKNIKALFSNFYVGNYQPVSMLTYAIEYKLAGLNPKIYHFTNFFLHLINTLLVFVFVKKLSSKIVVAVIASVLFGIHPLHVESVVWVSERKDVLYAFFYMAGLLTYLKYKEKGGAKYYILTILLFAFSCLSKAMAVSFSVILILIDYLRMKKFNYKMLIDKIPFFIISLVFGLIAIYVQKLQGASTFIENAGSAYTSGDKFFLANYSLFFYIYKMFLPLGLSVIHPYPYKINDSIPTIYYLSPVINALIIGLVICSLKKGKIVVFGFLFFFFNIVQVVQILSIGSAIAADRYFYISSIGFFYIIGEGFNSVYTSPVYKKYKPVLIAGSCSIILLLSYMTFQRTSVWKDSGTLWTDMIKTYPKNELSFYNRGVYYYDMKQFDSALADFSEAIIRNPEYIDAISARVSILSNRKDYKNALPDLSKLIMNNPGNAKNYISRGTIYRELFQNKLALEDFEKAVKLAPDNYAGYMNLGIQYSIEEKYKEALTNFDKSQELSPKSAEVYSNRGNLYSMMRNFDKALTDYNKSIELNPNLANSYFYRAVIYSDRKKYDEALNDYLKVISLEPNNSDAYYKASLIYSEKKDKKNALEYALKAKSLGMNIDEKYTGALSTD